MGMGFALRSPAAEIRVLSQFSRSRNFKGLSLRTFIGYSRLENMYKCYSMVNKEASISGYLVPEHMKRSYAGKRQLKESLSELEPLRTLLVDNYDSYTYNIYQELSVVNGMAPVVIYNDQLSWEEIYHYVYELRAFDNIIISPGPGSPACAADIGLCLRLLRECPDIPILGICLGHQALGYAHSARIIHAPEPVHGRLSNIEHNNCDLFNGIPSSENSDFKVVRYHSLVIDANSLPEVLIPIAWTSSSQTIPFLETENFNPVLNGSHTQAGLPIFSGSKKKLAFNSSKSARILNENVLMGIMHSSRPHYGLQFHPESVATHFGTQIFKNFSNITKDFWYRQRSSSASMQIPGMPLSQDVAATKHLVNKSFNKGLASHCYLMSPLMPKKSKFLKLKWKKIKSSASNIGGTEIIFCELFGQDRATNTFWLDSSSTEMSGARFSFMGGKGGPLWKQLTFRLTDRCDHSTSNCGGSLSIEDAEGFCTSTYLEDGFFNFLNQELQSFCYDSADYEDLPFEFFGGYVGYIGYDLKAECGVSENRHKSSTPDACLFFVDNLVVIDHQCDDIFILSVLDAKTSTTPWLDSIEQKLLNMHKARPLGDTASSAPMVSAEAFQSEGFLAEKSREQYIRDIGKCQKFIKDGESYEICLTTQMKRRVEKIDSLGLYLYLRGVNPAPYAAWLDFSKENLCICCSSPERFLRLDKNRILEAKPIKGTIARGKSSEEDELLKLQLQFSEKDQAENLMIVDLLRNDLGRVCEPGSVHVPHLMEVESYATVHTMVSTIRGKQRSNVTALDCIQAAFPGGSMTGAPKLRTMEILDSLESCSRGIYSGCIGYLCYNQTFDLNIVIRTIVIHEGEASIGAGGAITALSNPEDEYEEMILKTRAPSEAVMEFQRRCYDKEAPSI